MLILFNYAKYTECMVELRN